MSESNHMNSEALAAENGQLKEKLAAIDAEDYEGRLKAHQWDNNVLEQQNAELSEYVYKILRRNSDIVAAAKHLISVVTVNRQTTEAGPDIAKAIDALSVVMDETNAGVSFTSAPPAMAIVWHETLESIDRAYWAPVAEAEGIPLDELIASDMEGQNEKGDIVSITYEQKMEGMRIQGCWGFVDTKTNTIHAWASPDVNQTTLIHMLTHEIGHVTGVAHPDGLQEELRAEQFGLAASQALTLMQQRAGAVCPCCNGTGRTNDLSDGMTLLGRRVYELTHKLAQADKVIDHIAAATGDESDRMACWESVDHIIAGRNSLMAQVSDMHSAMTNAVNVIDLTVEGQAEAVYRMEAVLRTTPEQQLAARELAVSQHQLDNSATACIRGQGV